MNDLDSVDNNSSQSEELTREQRAILALSTMAAEDKLFAEKLYYAMNSIYLYRDEVEHMVRWAKRARELGARTDKDFSGDSMTLQFNFGKPESYTHLGITVAREAVCTPRVVGKDTKTVMVYDECPTEEIEVDIVEWNCGSILSAATGDE